MNSNWATWLIFGLLILALISFLIFSYFNDKNKNKKLLQKKIELKKATIQTSKELAIRIYTLIEMNEEFLKKVIPGKSKIKMKNVNQTCKTFLKDIYDSKSFKVLYIESDEADPSYSRNFKKLIDVNSNLWSKYCQMEINYFKKLHDELKDDEKFDLIKNDSIKIIQDFFEKEVNKNNESSK